MSKTPPDAGIFVHMPDGMRGPFRLKVLRDLVDGGAISEETLVGDPELGPCIPLGQHEIAGELFQPKRMFNLKRTEFQRVNTTDSAPLDHHDMIRMANQRDSDCQQAAPAPPKPLNDVELLVRKTALAIAARESPMIFVRRRNQRRRDYLFLIMTGDGIGAVLAIAFRHYPLPLAGVVSFMAIYTVVVTWIMWAIVGRY